MAVEKVEPDQRIFGGGVESHGPTILNPALELLPASQVDPDPADITIDSNLHFIGGCGLVFVAMTVTTLSSVVFSAIGGGAGILLSPLGSYIGAMAGAELGRRLGYSLMSKHILDQAFLSMGFDKSAKSKMTKDQRAKIESMEKSMTQLAEYGVGGLLYVAVKKLLLEPSVAFVDSASAWLVKPSKVDQTQAAVNAIPTEGAEVVQIFSPLRVAGGVLLAILIIKVSSIVILIGWFLGLAIHLASLGMVPYSAGIISSDISSKIFEPIAEFIGRKSTEMIGLKGKNKENMIELAVGGIWQIPAVMLGRFFTVVKTGVMTIETTERRENYLKDVFLSCLANQAIPTKELEGDAAVVLDALVDIEPSYGELKEVQYLTNQIFLREFPRDSLSQIQVPGDPPALLKVNLAILYYNKGDSESIQKAESLLGATEIAGLPEDSPLQETVEKIRNMISLKRRIGFSPYLWLVEPSSLEDSTEGVAHDSST